MVAETPPAPAGALVAVGSAQTADAAKGVHDLEAIKKLATQTKAIGVILPPPDIRAIVDKTAQFVAKNGARDGTSAGWREGVPQRPLQVALPAMRRSPQHQFEWHQQQQQ
jgi:hypothetical protein